MGARAGWRRQGVVGLVAVGALACGVAAGEAVDGGHDGTAERGPLPPAGSPLHEVPWLVPEGAPRIDAVAPLASARFAAGVGYPEALERLLIAALGDGELPAGATLAPPLPAEVVMVRPGAGGAGIRLSLTAPWGYDESGRIRAPSVGLPPEWTAGQVRSAMGRMRGPGAALPAGARVDAPPLAACQVAEGTPDNRPTCPERP